MDEYEVFICLENYSIEKDFDKIRDSRQIDLWFIGFDEIHGVDTITGVNVLYEHDSCAINLSPFTTIHRARTVCFIS